MVYHSDFEAARQAGKKAEALLRQMAGLVSGREDLANAENKEDLLILGDVRISQGQESFGLHGKVGHIIFQAAPESWCRRILWAQLFPPRGEPSQPKSPGFPEDRHPRPSDPW
jgi:hypothetical protein